jgi:hypothetical protein
MTNPGPGPGGSAAAGFGTLDWSHWLYGLLAAFIGGGASAVASGITVSIKDPEKFSLGSGNFFELLFIVFMTSGSLSFFAFLKQQPLPPVITRTTVETAVQQSPEVKVVTTVEKTVVSPSPTVPTAPVTFEAGKKE